MGNVSEAVDHDMASLLKLHCMSLATSCTSCCEGEYLLIVFFEDIHHFKLFVLIAYLEFLAVTKHLL